MDEALDAERRFHVRYTLHGTSHMLGLDVHDCANARNDYRDGELVPGMVLTVEPGCYLQPDDLTVPERYRGIGVRIEDDVVITENGYRNLSAALPTTAEAVELWMERLLAALAGVSDCICDHMWSQMQSHGRQPAADVFSDRAADSTAVCAVGPNTCGVPKNPWSCPS